MTSPRIRCMAAAIVALLTIAAARADAQATIGPSRPGGNPMSVSTVAFPSGGLSPLAPGGGQVQRGTLTVTDPAVTATTGSIIVLSSSFVRVRFLGWNCGMCAGANTGNTEVGYLTVNVVDGTHITLTLTRAAADGGTASVQVEYEVTDLNPLAVKSIQRATATLGGASTVISAVVMSKTEVDYLGQIGATAAGAAFFGLFNLLDSTHVSSAAATNLTGSFQVIEYN